MRLILILFFIFNMCEVNSQVNLRIKKGSVNLKKCFLKFDLTFENESDSCLTLVASVPKSFLYNDYRSFKVYEDSELYIILFNENEEFVRASDETIFKQYIKEPETRRSKKLNLISIEAGERLTKKYKVDLRPYSLKLDFSFFIFYSPPSEKFVKKKLLDYQGAILQRFSSSDTINVTNSNIHCFK